MIVARSKSYKGILQGDADEGRNAAAPGSDAGGDADAPRLALHGGRVICYDCARGVDCDAVEAGLVAAHGGGELGRGIGAAGDGYYYGGGVCDAADGAHRVGCRHGAGGGVEWLRGDGCGYSDVAHNCIAHGRGADVAQRVYEAHGVWARLPVRAAAYARAYIYNIVCRRYGE